MNSELKADEELLVVGKRLPRVDARVKSTGEARYCGDMKLPGMLHARILRSPYPHAKIVYIDVSRAKKLPGVKAVVTAEDTPKVKVGPQVADELPLAVDKVRFIGDEVAAVAAVDLDTCAEALQLIDVEYQPLPAVFDPFEAMRPGSPLIHEVEQNIVARYEITRGDVDQAFTECDVVCEGTFSTPVVHQGYLEPLTYVATCDSSGRLTLWAPDNYVFLTRDYVAKALGLALGQVRVIQPYVGGSFGGKAWQRGSIICALLAQKLSGPVMLANTQEEEFTASRPRVPITISMKLGARRDGTILAKESNIVADNGAYTCQAPTILGRTVIGGDSVYRYGNIRSRAVLVYTNNVPTSSYRGFGSPQMAFALESLLDTVAGRLGMDSAELRLKNVIRTGDVSAHGYMIGSCGLEQCIRNAIKKTNWKEKKASKRPGYGLGMGCLIHNSGSRAFFDLDAASIIVKVDEDGRATIIWGEGDIGQGGSTILAQIAAEELGVHLEDVRLSSIDTDSSPYSLGVYGSRGTFVTGNAVKLAASEVKRQLLDVASRLLEVDPDDLVSQDGKIFVRGTPAKALGLAEVARRALQQRGGAPLLGIGTFDSPSVRTNRSTLYGNASGAYSFGAQVAEVKVDPATGEVTVVNFLSAYDLGKAINPTLAEGQLEGAIVQGLGYALTEETVIQNGLVLNPHLSGYKIPTAKDVPAVQSVLVECKDSAGPFGAKSVGEGALVGTAPAVANAIYDAIGVRITSLPITPEKVYKALREQERNGRITDRADGGS